MPIVKEFVNKVPPQSIEAEIAVLGSMLLDKEAIDHAIELLDEASFYKTAHAKIYSTVIKLYDKNKAVDIVTLVEELRNSSALDEVGGPAYITSITSSSPTPVLTIVAIMRILRVTIVSINIVPNSGVRIFAKSITRRPLSVPAQ